jgi:putative peptidoglycan lipid II flippase
VKGSVRFAPARKDRIIGTGAESEAIEAPAGTPAALPGTADDGHGPATEDVAASWAPLVEPSGAVPPAEMADEPQPPGARLPSGGIGRATAVMMGGTLLSRVTGLLRLLVAAYALGIGRLSDAFNLANNTPNIVHDLVLGGILSATFVPLFVDRLTRDGEDEADDAISSVVTLSFVVLLVATVLFVALAPVIIDLYSLGTHNHEIGLERQVATELLRMFAPQLLAYGAISLMTAVLNSVRRFTLPAYVPVLNNLFAIVILFEFASVAHHATLASVGRDAGLLLLLGFGTTAGVVVQALALVPSTLRCGIRLHWRWAPRHAAVREIISLSGWTFGFVITNQIALFVALALAVHIDPTGGAVTAYSYAFIFFQLPFGMIAVSVMSAATPELAGRWTRRDLEGMAHHFGLGLRRMMAGIWPATAGYLVLAGPIMKLLLLHGRASNAGVHLTGSLLALLGVGLPGYCVYLYAIRALQAMRDTRSAFYLYVVENGLNVVLLFVLTRLIGPQGLAVSLSLAYTVAALLALWVVRRKMGSLGGATVRHYVWRSLLLSIVMAICVALVATAIGSSSGVGLFERVVVSVIIGLAVYGGGAVLAGHASGWQTADGRRHAAGKGA